MKSEKIFPFICELSFGNPNGEAIMSMAFVLVIGFIIYKKMKDEQQGEFSDK